MLSAIAISLSALEILDPENPDFLVIDNTRFQLNPVIKISNYPQAGNYIPQLVFRNISSRADTTYIVYEYSICRLTLKISEYPFIDNAYSFEYHLSGRQELKLKDLFIEFSADNISNTLYGPEAIYYNDSSYNLPTVPFKDRIVKYEIGNRQLYITGSKYPGTSNIEVIKDNNIFIYDSDFHKAFWGKGNVWLDWKILSEQRRISGSFIISSENPDYPLFNYFPKGKKAAFTLSSDADYETVNRLRAIFFGSNITSHPDYGTKGLVANDLRVTNSIFGYHWERDAAVHQEIIAAGNRIAYHTYYSMKDERIDLINNLQNEVSDLGINYWIDHNAGLNPEDLAANGAVPGSDNYILDILEDASFKYAWITDSKNYKRNAFDEYFELPHHCEAMTGDYELYILGRRSGINWEWMSDSYHLGFKPNVTDSTITDLLAHRGLMHMYTHLCMPNTGGTIGFLDFIDSDSRYEIKPDVETCFRMLNYHQTFSGLWVAPAEEIYDRMFIVDSLKITFIRNLSDRTIFDIHNPTDQHLTNMEISYMNNDFVLDLPPGSTETIMFRHPLNVDSDEQIPDENTQYVDITEDENEKQDGILVTTHIVDSSLIIKVMLAKKEHSTNINIYNIKGQKVLSKLLPAGIQTLRLPISDLSTGMYLVRCKSGKQTKIVKALILK